MPLLCPHGQTGQVQHIEHVGVGHLVAQREADEVKIRDGVAALQAVERQALSPHLLFHIPPGGEHPLAPAPGQVVHHAVEDAHAQIGHADFIGIRETEGVAHLHLPPVLDHRVVFSARVPGRLLHPGQDAFQTTIHDKPPSVRSIFR